MKVKILGAGSIGNHLAQAARRMGWQVAVVDNDVKALERMKSNIYPARYGLWDDTIELYEAGKEPKTGFDIIMIGTPPHIRMKLALESLMEKPKLLHLEKPLCTPFLEYINEFSQNLKNSETIVTVGYDHGVAESVEAVINYLKQNIIGNILTIDVEFREHWRGILAAHPWLNGPRDSYLGFWRQGGGAGCEHSHALHLWQTFAEASGWQEINDIKAIFDLQKKGGADYDQLAAFLLKTRDNKIGRVVQDVITYPTKKWARLQGNHGFIEWICNSVPVGDVVRYQIEGQDLVERIFPKKRPDDFYRLMLHYQKLINGEIKPESSPLHFNKGLSIMNILHNTYPIETT